MALSSMRAAMILKRAPHCDTAETQNNSFSDFSAFRRVAVVAHESNVAAKFWHQYPGTQRISELPAAIVRQR